MDGGRGPNGPLFEADQLVWTRTPPPTDPSAATAPPATPRPEQVTESRLLSVRVTPRAVPDVRGRRRSPTRSSRHEGETVRLHDVENVSDRAAGGGRAPRAVAETQHHLHLPAPDPGSRTSRCSSGVS